MKYKPLIPYYQAQWMLAGKRSGSGPPAGLHDGDPVSSWLDSSGNGHNAAQSGSARPIFKTNILNGKPVVRFTTAGLSSLNLVSNISGAGPFSCFVVFKANSAATEQISIASTDGTPYGPAEINGSFYFSNRANYFSNASDYSGAFHVFSVLTNGASTAAFYGDGNVLGLVTNPLVGTGDFSSIGWRSTGPLYSDGDIAEIIFYNVQTSGTDAHNIEKYLGTKYGITVASGSAVQPDTVSGLQGWWKADSLL